MNRRELILGLAAMAASLPAASILGSGFALAQTARFGSIVVDTKPLEARGGRGAAAILRPQLQASLQREFAGGIGRGGPELIVRIHTVYLSPFAGDSGGRRGVSGSDYLEGEVQAGRVRLPLFATQNPSMYGAWYLPDSEARRLRALAVQFAHWVRRKV
jgi:hypothetical protein